MIARFEAPPVALDIVEAQPRQAELALLKFTANGYVALFFGFA